MMFEFCASAGCGISKEIATKFEETNNAVSILVVLILLHFGVFQLSNFSDELFLVTPVGISKFKQN